MSKYIIKNCPAIATGWEDKDYICNTHQNGCGYCKDCTDCLLKQIVDKCKEELEKEKNLRYHTNGFILATKILHLLDISEVE